ncbi:hypothetical protein NCT2013_42360 [Enterobacter sp. M4-VN]|nr:hypothetical protein NCT2013_42360 [Enterobacter sp. M4-VN]
MFILAWHISIVFHMVIALVKANDRVGYDVENQNEYILSSISGIDAWWMFTNIKDK